MKKLKRAIRFLFVAVILCCFLSVVHFFLGNSPYAWVGFGFIQKPARMAANCVSDWAQVLLSFRKVVVENRELKRQNFILLAERARLSSVDSSNKRLEKLLKLKQSTYTNSTAANVIARDPNLWFSEITVDKGWNDGVTPQTVAVCSGGLVGKVCVVGGCWSKIRLLQAPQSSVPVKLAKSGALGVLYGDGSHSFTMKFIKHDVKISDGEAVLTSGIGTVYPKDIPVGHVSQQYGRTEVLFQSVQVTPSADMASISEVLLLTRVNGHCNKKPTYKPVQEVKSLNLKAPETESVKNSSEENIKPKNVIHNPDITDNRIVEPEIVKDEQSFLTPSPEPSPTSHFKVKFLKSSSLDKEKNKKSQENP